MEITLRLSTKDDFDFLFNVTTIAMKNTRLLLASKYYASEEERLEYFKQSFKPSQNQIIIYNNIEVGRLRVEKLLDHFHIGTLEILPEYQSKGIGSAIINLVIEDAQMINYPVYLEVHKVNIRAYQLYQKLGFKTEQITPFHYIMVHG